MSKMTLMEMYNRDSPFSKTVDSISKCCISIHYQLKIQDDNCLREWTFQDFKCIFLEINFFNSTTSNAHNSAKNKARDLLQVSFCREFYLVWLPGLNSKPTTWYLFIWTHTYADKVWKATNLFPEGNRTCSSWMAIPAPLDAVLSFG